MSENKNGGLPKLIPVLLGADLNAYNIAKAFHERYGVVSYAFGRYAVGATKYSRIVRFTAVENLDTEEVAIETLLNFAREHGGSTLIAFGCTDDYVGMISKNKKRLEGTYIVPYIDYDLMERITRKEEFYKICEELEIPYPKTKIYHKGDTLNDLGFDYPIIIKPSVSALYWHFPFDGMKKVYRAKSREDAEKIIGAIYGAGYPENLIIQDTVPGDDSRMYVMTAYCDRNAKVRMMCLGHVLLEEHTPKGRGNHCAIMTEYNKELYDRFRLFLEKINYVGFANFDIKYDERDGSLRAFEINTRLGRSSDYVTSAGYNTVGWYVSDYVEKKNFDGCIYNDNEIYWRYIPDSVVFDYLKGDIAGKVRELIKDGKVYSSLRYPYDFNGSLRRRFYVLIHEFRHKKKFKTYYPAVK